jgi:hypothetical protein
MTVADSLDYLAREALIALHAMLNAPERQRLWPEDVKDIERAIKVCTDLVERKR